MVEALGDCISQGSAEKQNHKAVCVYTERFIVRDWLM